VLRFSHLPSFASSFVHQTSALGTQSRQDIVQPEQRNASMVCQARDSSLFGGVRWPSHRRMLTADAALSLQPLDELMDGREWEMKEGCQADKARPVVGLSQRHSMSRAGATGRTVSFDAFVESGNGLGSAMRTHLRVASTKPTYNPRDGHRIAWQCSHVKGVSRKRHGLDLGCVHVLDSESPATCVAGDPPISPRWYLSRPRRWPGARRAGSAWPGRRHSRRPPPSPRCTAGSRP